MKFNTVNPVTEEIIGEYETMASDEIFEIAGKVNGAYKEWKRSSIEDRSKHLMNAARVLRKNKDGYARLMTLEMGKPMKESLAEIEKCAWLAEVYARNSQRWLSDTTVGADGKEHRIIYQPLGCVLSIMPWNFPFWQALRFALPTLPAGNVSVLTH